ncbi:hypothetical protein P3647_15930 [Vibrio parahaemolyticus]|uniref:hypothetical protein n=1 Tax=Vibrio harveyi group TaxID=717610 RepID=UPI00211AD9DC|nr:hypothetical protein [Vibrio diabolicus]MCG9621264.1 hypothetical protein [Vibrio diabolicus]MDF5206747.1 hypothetical protein [Vibrio parahaemolyticus]MDF5216769.1 hypothetical protein [Vibrio parahaemolyticus]HCG7286880.1 hypothetical protein [Vibrio parahaemolyticus]
MGRAKAELIRQQELQPMYDWIEENYGCCSEEEGSEEWEEAVSAYEDYCENQYIQEQKWRRNEELEWYIYSQSPIGMFNTQMQSVRALLDLEVYNETQFSLLVMLHGHAVASVESYLAAKFIHKVTNSEELIRKLVESDPVFSERKFTLKEIYEKHEGIKLTVAKYLKDLIFHDLKKVKPMFKNVLGYDFGDISWLFKAINLRHHCVHRAGLDKDGNRIDLSVDSIRNLVDKSTCLIWSIEEKV